MSKINRLHRRVTRILYHRGITVHGEYLGLFLGLLVMVFLSYLLSSPSIHADYNVFNPSTGDVDVNYSIGQRPTFVVDTNGFNGKIASTTVTTLDGRTAKATPQIKTIDNGTDYSIVLNPTEQPEPGRYRINVAIQDGISTRTVTQDFTWGVLALNMARSSYQPHQPVTLGMAVLDDNGVTLCDADTQVEITAPNGKLTTLTTAKKQIVISKTCQDKSVTNNPDYTANYVPAQTGRYTVRMSTTTIRGMRSMESSFEVTNHADFVSDRVNTAMRLYPSSPYNVTLDIHANTAFDGSIDEPLPNSFTVTKPLLTLTKASGRRIIIPAKQFTTVVQGSVKSLQWSGLSLGRGDMLELTYAYKAPYISPAFYQLGPAYLTNTAGKRVFQEPRAWQLAGDAVNDVILLWDTANGVVPTGWTCISCVSGNAFYQLFPYMNTTYAGTGGGPESVNHTLTFSSMSAPSATQSMNSATASKTESSSTHTHTFAAPTVSSNDIKPPYKDLEFIEAISPLGLPANVIGMFDVTSTAGLPTDWSAYTPLDDPNSTGSPANGVYLRGAGDVATGGATSHTDTITAVTSGAASGTTTVNNSGSNATPSTTHTHTISAQSLPAEANDPLFTSVVFAKLGVANEALPTGLMAMFDTTPLPTGWSAVTTIDGVTGTAHLLKGTLGTGATTSYTGGISTSNLGGSVTFTTGPPTGTAGTGPNSSTTNATIPTSTHTHNVTYTVSAANAMPLYRSVMLGKMTDVTVSGTVYSDDGVTTLGSVPVKLSINGTAFQTTTAAANGTYSISIPNPGTGAVLTAWLNTGGGSMGSVVTRSNNAAISGLNIYKNDMIVRHEDTGPITNSDISKCTKTLGTVCADSDLHFDVASGNLTVDNDTRLFIGAASTFTPGGTVTLSPGASASSNGGDLKFGSATSALNIGANTLNIGGDWDNTAGGTFTKSTGQQTNMTGTVTGLSVISSSKNFDKLAFTGTGGTWAFSPVATAANVDNDFSITAATGVVTAPSGTLSLGGSFTNAGTFTNNSGTVAFTATATGKTINPGSSNFNNVTFNGSGGEWSPLTNALNIAGDLTMTAGTLDNVNGTANVTVNGNAVGTAGTLSLTGDTFTQRVTAAKNFGPTTAGTNWAFSNLTFSNGNVGATPETVTTQTGTGTMTISGILAVGASGDAIGATTTLDAGNRNWILSGTNGSPFQILASPAGALTANTSTFTYSGNNASGNTTIQNATYYSLAVNNAAETYVPTTTLTATNNLNVAAGTLTLGANNLVVGSSGVVNSGGISVPTGGSLTQTTPATTTLASSSGGAATIGGAGTTSLYNLTFAPTVATAPTFTLGSATGQTISIANTFTVGNGINPATVTAATNNPIVDVNGNVTINTSGTFVAPGTSSFTVAGSWTNAGTFTNNSGTVTFDSGSAGNTITSGGTGVGKNFYAVSFNNTNGSWTIQTNDLTAASNFALTNIGSLTVQSGRTVEVDGTYSVCDSCAGATSWAGASLYLNSATAYTVGSKTQGSEVYGTLQIGANTDIRTWNSSAATDTVAATGSLYSQNDANTPGSLKIYGDYHVTGIDYWDYAKDFDGTALIGAAQRQATVQIQTGTGVGVTVDAAGTLNVQGGGGGTNQFTNVDRIGASGVYHLVNNNAATVQEAHVSNASLDGGTWTVLNTLPANVALTAGTFNVDWYVGGHVVDNDSPTTNIDTAATDVTVSENSGTPASTVFKESSGAWGSGATSQTTGTDSNGALTAPNTDGALRIREYSQTTGGTTYYTYNIAVAAQSQFATYDYNRDYGNYITSTSNTTSPDTQTISTAWYRDTVATQGADGTLNGAVPNGTWYIGMTKAILGFWDTASGSIPTGWSCVSCVSGDPFYQQFIRGATSYDGTGGGPELEGHHLTYVSATASPTFTSTSGSKVVASGSHTHTWIFPGGTNTNTVDIKPPYKDMEVIRGPVEGTNAWPTNIVMAFSSATAPTGWSAYTALDGRYIRGMSDNTTGGSATHTNTTNTLTSGASGTTVSGTTCASSCTAADASAHTHTLPATTTPTGQNDPPYVNVRFMQHNNNSLPPLRTLIGLYDYTTLPSDYYEASNAAPFQNNLLTGATSGIESTGGSATDNETGTMNITSGAETQTAVNLKAGSGVTASTSTGTHTMTYSIDAVNTIPDYRDVVESNYMPQAPPQAPTTLVQAKTDDTVITSGAWVNTNTIKFSAQVTSDNIPTQQLQLCIEKKPIGTSFSNVEDSCGTAVTQTTGNTVTATDTLSGIADGQYHWQARVKDAFGEYSPWTTFNNTGLNTTVDYGVDATPPSTAAAIVYDNTNLDTQPYLTDATENSDGSLTTLSASWTGFDSSVSGINKYQYSIGTTAGGTDIKGWTDGTTNTYERDNSLTLQTAQNYYYNVRAVDNAGNTSGVVSSDGQIVTPTLTFDIYTDSNPSPPYASAFGTLTPSTVTTSPSKVWVNFQTNGVSGGQVYIASANGGLKSTVAGTTISSASGNLDSMQTGFGAQGYSVTQTSGGPFTLASPFNGPGNTIGVLNGSYQSIFSSSTPVVGGLGSFQLKAKVSPLTAPANDYSDTLTIVAAGTY